MIEEDYKKLGLPANLTLKGQVRLIRFEKNAPTVFLIDEHHGNLNNCIESNIKNAEILIKNAYVQLIGVESHAGGRQWDQYYQEYVEDEFYNNELVNTCPDFYNSIFRLPILVLGVECWGILDKIQCDLSGSGNPHYGQQIEKHPLNIERSKHFIKTLFELKTKNNIQANLVLNCGANHNTHIEELINTGEIERITGQKASYVRINTIE